ncbi:MAG: tyrosine-type recombinase/integrase, partial [Sporomusa sp.]
LENGVIMIRAAKNMKQRFVPMSSSMNVLLKEYYEMVRWKGICSDYLFEKDSRYGTGKPYKNVTFEQWFAKILCVAQIDFTRSTPHERGPCPHCLRHLFVFDSLHKSESEGRAFDETASSLSAYLGHENLFSLEKYLNKDYSLYRRSHQRVNEFIKDVFPEVSFL